MSEHAHSSELTAPMAEAADPVEQDRVVEQLLSRLTAAEFLPDGRSAFLAGPYRDLDQRVRATFHVPHTTMTPLARRLLFGIAVAHRPRRMVVLGSFVGYAAVWLFGPALSCYQLFAVDRLLACDIFEPAVLTARENFASLPGGDQIQVVHSDAADWLAADREPIDLLYLDVDNIERGKRDYVPLLEAALPKLTSGSLVLAHDVTHPDYIGHLDDYRALVSDRSKFRRSATIEVDPCGLEVTLV
jgi:predicted O-methyltransferase YrrM